MNCYQTWRQDGEWDKDEAIKRWCRAGFKGGWIQEPGFLSEGQRYKALVQGTDRRTVPSVCSAEEVNGSALEQSVMFSLLDNGHFMRC